MKVRIFPANPKPRVERAARIAGGCLQAALLAALLAFGLASLLSLSGQEVLFRYQGF